MGVICLPRVTRLNIRGATFRLIPSPFPSVPARRPAASSETASPRYSHSSPLFVDPYTSSRPPPALVSIMATLSNPANLVSESSSSSTSATAGPSRKRKADNKQDNEGKKRLPSCDLCRARKVKCVKNEGSPRCEGCQSLNQRCEYTYERRKPGPVNR